MVLSARQAGKNLRACAKGSGKKKCRRAGQRLRRIPVGAKNKARKTIRKLVKKRAKPKPKKKPPPRRSTRPGRGVAAPRLGFS